MKQVLCFIVILLSGSCRMPGTITVKLKTAKENDGLLGSTQILLTEKIKDAKPYKALADMYGLDTFIVSLYPHSPEEYYFKQYRKEEIDSVFLNKLVKEYGIDTTKLTTGPYDAETIILLGRKTNGDCLIVADTNNNNDLLDDQPYTLNNWFNENKKLPIDSLPYINISNLVSNYNNSKAVFSASIYLKPLKRDSSFLLKNKPLSQLSVSVISTEYLWGKFKVNGKKYVLAARNLNSKYVFDKQSSIIEVARKKKLFQFKETNDISKLSHIGDILNLKSKAIEFSSIEANGSQINLSVRPKMNNNNIVSDFSFEEFTRKDTFRFQELLNKYNYVIVDFWGSWCRPCIASFPEIKSLSIELENKRIGFVGFIYDEIRNKNKIDSLLCTGDIDWHQMLIESSLTNTIIQQHKVFSYPTYFLIDKTGKIVYRSTGIGGLNRMKEFMIKNKII